MNVRRLPRVWLYAAIRVLSLVALAFASALAVDYYFNANTFCSAGASCDVVANSEFGQKYGIFLPTLGLLAYTVVYFSSFYFARTRRKVFGKSLGGFWFPVALFACALGAMLFIVVQALEVKAFCWLCMGIDSAALLMVIPGILLLMGDKTEGRIEEPRTCPHWLVWAGLYVLAAGVPMAWGSFQPPAKTQQIPDFVARYHEADKVNIVEISSFDCPRCRELHPELSKLIEEYGDKVNFKRVTVPFDRSRKAVIAYHCAEYQQGYERFADCMFEKPTKVVDEMREYAMQCELDLEAFNECLADPSHAEEVEEILTALRASDFKGAPTVWIDDLPIVGYHPDTGMDVYRNAIEKRSSNDSHLPLALIICLVLAAILSVAGVAMGWRQRLAK